nr:immunoglobulin heavy chain junction region [Macaca mulatta]MOX00932.1 immunoglobulin heavy chain junction region [Macaca mulatta]MOX03122.1 immunoglobulin heavy chain junction region [Macaca mulatta]MOX04105.1 immunoglobulin heavy chain junction region [Macaca mulatta]MOX04873.1 immunoglobulin heavy chain junction region [Macaca mulatta]
CARDQSNFDYW